MKQLATCKELHCSEITKILIAMNVRNYIAMNDITRNIAMNHIAMTY